MARKPRLTYAGAVYHVMCRGNHRQRVFRGDEDCQRFLSTLGEVCTRTGWKIHAYVLMGNHYHLLLETPEPNLPEGMRWLQGTYTKRFNALHRECGHLFQGRYKAIPIDADSAGYFLSVATYIHLNPVRMKGYDFTKNALSDYIWSSYPGYVRKRRRLPWLSVERVLADLHLPDTPSGRRRFADYMAKRILEVRHADKPWEADAQWKRLRRGWYMGEDDFKAQLLGGMADLLSRDRGTPFGGAAIRQHNKEMAERLVAEGMERLGLRESDLAKMPKNCVEKYALAWFPRHQTSVDISWIKQRLHMGKATDFSARLTRLGSSPKESRGYAVLEKLKKHET